MEMTSIQLIDKPAGMTSFDVIRRLRGILGISKIGHAGTLDPLATGLMIVGIGRSGTKQLHTYLKMDKTYHVDVLLGKRTDTADLEGEILSRKPVTELSAASVESVLEQLTGDIELPVPRYSAVKIDGVPLHKRVRRGEVVQPPHRTMRVSSMALTHMERQGEDVLLTVTMDVASGVYVRSVVEAIGDRLEVPACVYALRRTRIGPFQVEDAVTLNEVAVSDT
jgi:tRNA pseudouridine55 synthase